jgi:hypothetical protein
MNTEAASPREEQRRLAPPEERRATAEPYGEEGDRPKARPMGSSDTTPDRPEWARDTGAAAGSSEVSTPVAKESRGREPASPPESLEGRLHSPYAHTEGLRTWGRRYMPFAAGFEHMAAEAAVYRPSRLHALSPTGACDDDFSYYFQLVRD